MTKTHKQMNTPKRGASKDWALLRPFMPRQSICPGHVARTLAQYAANVGARNIITRDEMRSRIDSVGVAKKIDDSAHPLFGEKGFFARCSVRRLTVIGVYGGDIFTEEDVDNHGAHCGQKRAVPCDKYAWELPLLDRIKGASAAAAAARQRARRLYVIGTHHGNNLAYINDYRNVRPSPNVNAAYAWIADAPRIVYYTVKDVECGEELVGDYGNHYF